MKFLLLSTHPHVVPNPSAVVYFYWVPEKTEKKKHHRPKVWNDIRVNSDKIDIFR